MLIHKGAEAYLYVEYWNNRLVLKKYRIPKRYRIPELDLKLRIERTRHEAKLMYSARKAGVPTPLIYFVDIPNTTIIMQYLAGKKVKGILDENKVIDDKIYKIFSDIGTYVAKLHKNNIIHGDLTTSNMIIYENTLFFIDFGLGFFSSNIEDKAVDLHLLKTILKSTHNDFYPQSFNIITEAYIKEYGKEQGSAIINRIASIEVRGRYITER
ncbi:MAG: Kae1-associated serine/threonine protein kinase [Candidatus Odinarchaeota archaeon]|nr:Kae1-associated serine/threonine protein kinase [Candidatus Odinarchaeota archaeon]